LSTRPATKMFYLVAGCTFLIEAYDNWSHGAVSEIFSGWFFTALPECDVPAPDATIRVRSGVNPPAIPPGLAPFPIINGGTCFTDGSRYYIKFDDSLVAFGPGKSRQVDLWIDKPYPYDSGDVVQLLCHALSPALRRCNIFEIHSGGVIPPHGDKAILIAGPSGSGKSTLTSQLANSGWRYLSDDILLVYGGKENLHVQAFRRFFALTANTISALKLTRVAPSEGSGRYKERVIPQEHFGPGLVQEAVPRTMVFPMITGEPQSRTTQLTPTQTMSRLLRLCPWASYDKPTSVQHLQTLGALANGTTAYDLFAGTDILDDPNVVTKMFYTLAEEFVLKH
jgi:hypothetical protein